MAILAWIWLEIWLPYNIGFTRISEKIFPPHPGWPRCISAYCPRWLQPSVFQLIENRNAD